jgi:AraC family transcriptional regulator
VPAILASIEPRRLGIADLAAVAGLSPSHFTRLPRDDGQTPHRYVLRARLRHAEQLITSTDLPLPVIAQRAGFASHSHMSATMQRLCATTPRLLRCGVEARGRGGMF